MNKNSWYKLIFLLSVLLFVLTGCWSANETKDLAIINVLGVDLNENGNIELTTNVVKPSNIFSQTSTDSEVKQQQVLLETAEGENIFQALGKLSASIPKQIFLGHVNIVIFGEELAREQMVASLDFFKRQDDFRPNIQLFVTKGRAKDILEATPELSKTLGLEIDRLNEANRFSSANTVKDLSKFLEDLSSNTVDPITSGISYAEKKGAEVGVEGNNTKNKEGNTSPSNTNTNTKTTIVLSLNDTAVFKGGSLIGWLDEPETRGLLLIRGELDNDVVILDCGDKNAGTIALDIKNTEPRLSPMLNDGKTKMDIAISVEADIVQVTCPDINVNSGQLEGFNRKLENTLSREIGDVLMKAQKNWQTDIFGFGEQFYRKYPSEWDQIAPTWRSGGLKGLDVNLSISADISRFGLLKEPSKPNESR